MSSNNLKFQLDWLLREKPCVPSSYFLQPVLDSIATPTATQQPHAEELAPATNAADPETLPADQSTTSVDMARLRAAASPSRKPRLVAQTSTPNPSRPPDPTFGVSDPSSPSLRRNSEAVRRHFPPTEDFHAQPPLDLHNKPRSRDNPRTAIATIDLTGDSGIGMIAAPAAQTPAISAYAGKKRTSEEYQEDLGRHELSETPEKRLHTAPQHSSISETPINPHKLPTAQGYSPYYSDSSPQSDLLVAHQADDGVDTSIEELLSNDLEIQQDLDQKDHSTYDIVVSTDSHECVKTFSKWTAGAIQRTLKACDQAENDAWSRYVDAVANSDESESALEDIHLREKAQSDSLKKLISLCEQYSSATRSRELLKIRFRQDYGSNSASTPLKLELQETTRSWRELEQQLISQIEAIQASGILSDNPPIAVPFTQATRFKNASTQTEFESPVPNALIIRQTQFPNPVSRYPTTGREQQRASSEESDDFDDEGIFEDSIDLPRGPVSTSEHRYQFENRRTPGEHRLGPAGSEEGHHNGLRHILAEVSPNAASDRNSRMEDAKIGFFNASKSSQGPPANAYNWSRDVKHALKHTFGLQGFRRNQLDTINATLGGKDVFVLMPTGGGKSLCYQLPAILSSGVTKGVTVVVSPLLSLMEDQISHLKQLHIQAVMLNGECTQEHRNVIMNGLRETNVESFIQLLYVTPEMLSKSKAIINALSRLHERSKLARIVIDEAHCVSQWGHDFRPDYKELGEIRNQFAGVPVMALTATATENVKVDVINNLNIRGCKVFTQSFNRPNLTYEVIVKNHKSCLDDMAAKIQEKYENEAGIIYCLSRNKCEEVANALRDKYKIKAHHYHAQVDSAEKKRIQAEWQRGGYQVIVATIAFGMGIDKANVRFVMHHSIPKSLEGYYQETGRAGRDGERAGCYLYYHYSDNAILQQMIQKSDSGQEQKNRQYEMLRRVVTFCLNKADCRRVQVLRYFNEDFPREKCNASCDNCNSNSVFVTRDFTQLAKDAIQVVRQTQSRNVTLLQCVDVLRGAKSKKISESGWNELDQYGIASDLERNDIERVFYRLIGSKALEEYSTTNKMRFTNQYIQLGKNYKSFLQGRQSIKIEIKASPTKLGLENARETTRALKPMPPATYLSSPTSKVAKSVQAPRTKSTKSGASIQQARSKSLRGYERDGGFCVPVPQADQDESDEFEPLNNKRSRNQDDSLSDPITTDDMMTDLTELHKEIVLDFVREAKEECKKIQRNKGLRSVPFTDTSLRSMAIILPPDKETLLEIPGVDPPKVESYGNRFLTLITKYRERLERLKHSTCRIDRPVDPNREIVDLVDDEEEMEEFDVEELDWEPEETSAYFPPKHKKRQGSSKKRTTWNGKTKKRTAGPKPVKSRGGIGMMPT